VITTDDQDLAEEVKRITGGKGALVPSTRWPAKAWKRWRRRPLRAALSSSTYGALAHSATPFPLFAALRKGLTLRGKTLFEVVGNPERMAKGKQYVLDGLASGKLKPIIAKTFPFEKIIDAHRFMESNEQIGKIIVIVD
jgi:NADPH:quinone reductase-like Zn-dependent oxidoreductase